MAVALQIKSNISKPRTIHRTAIFLNFARMILRSISILNFKNIAEAQLDFSSNVNCFIGDNGMGKTNLLDAIFYLSFCKSYTGMGDAALLQHDADFMLVQGKYDRRGQDEEISIGFKPGKRKAVKRGGKEYDKLSRHIGLLPLVMVSPMDWEMIRGTGEDRRRFVDQIISQGDSEYMSHLIKYARAIENRNVMLRRGFRDPLLFESIEQQISTSATYIHQSRTAWVEEFSPIFLQYYRQISDSAETVSLAYRSHLNQSAMQQLLNANRERDSVLGYTSTGVHRDDIELLLDDHPMRKIGSQGQCKTYTVAMRLAQYDFLKRMSGITPLLLLDDIFDKLDAHRVENIIGVVAGDTFGQIFITDTNRTHLDHIIRRVGKDYRTWSVKAGTFTLTESAQKEEGNK